MKRSLWKRPSLLGTVLTVGVGITAVEMMTSTLSWWWAPVWAVLALAMVWRPFRALIALFLWLVAWSLAAWWAYASAAVLSAGLLFVFGPGDATEDTTTDHPAQ